MKSFFQFFLYFILFLFSLELGLRVIDPASLSYYRNVKLLHRYHPEYYVTLGKNLDLYIRHYSNLWEGRFTTNSLGFRGSEEPDPNYLKLGCLGDSMVMGFGVGDEDSFCNILNHVEFNNKIFQTQNMAVDAYGSLGSAKRLKESAELVDFDTVLFFVSPNDFTVPPGLVEQGVVADDIIEKQRENDEDYRTKFRIQFELTRLSYLLQVAKLASEQLAIKKHFAITESKEEWEKAKNPFHYISSSFYRFPDKPECLPDEKALPSSAQPSDTPAICSEPELTDIGCIDSPPKISELEPLPDETIYAYNLMLSTVKAKNIHLIVVFLPMQNEDIRCHRYGKYSPLYNYALRAKTWFEENGIETIELLDESREICPLDDYYIPGDGHLTKKGNHWTARVLRKRLQSLGEK